MVINKMPKKPYTTEIFIEKAKAVHGERYSYEKINYVNSSIKVEIICLEHGSFMQGPSMHIRGDGCPKCSHKYRIVKKYYTKETLIIKAQEVHGSKYDYSEAEYVNSETKIIIICPEHGSFSQIPNDHFRGHGCLKCADEKKRRVSIDEFIQRANEIHFNKYDYSKVEFKSTKDKILIICPVHSEFYQICSMHLSGHGCSKCAGKYMDTELFKEKAGKVHNYKYDYTYVEYQDYKTKVNIICPIHGIFLQSPGAHSGGKGCNKCGNTYSPTTEEFIEKMRERHGDRYDYSKTVYSLAKNKVEIICKTHGSFLTTPSILLKGSGCSKCLESKGEKKVSIILDKLDISYERQKKFPTCKRKKCLPFDFYLPNYNLCIEFDGNQHFEVVDFFGGEEGLKLTQESDAIKNKWCKDNNINLLRIHYKTVDIESLIQNKLLEISKIKEIDN